MTATPTRLEASYWPAEPSEGVRDITVGELLREAAAAAPDRLALVDAVADPAARRSGPTPSCSPTSSAWRGRCWPASSPATASRSGRPTAADWVVLQQGIAMAGMVMVAINPAYRAARARSTCCAQSGAAGLFHVDSYRDVDLCADRRAGPARRLPALREVVSFSDWDAFLAAGDPEPRAARGGARATRSQIQYTSGTTGFPKGALLHHKGLVNEARFVAQRAGMVDGGVLHQRDADVPHRRGRGDRARHRSPARHLRRAARLRPGPDARARSRPTAARTR